MLSKYDYVIIGCYLVFVASMGWTFKRFNKGSNDYFAAGFRMSWWLLGTSVMLGNFTCWTFTGAAEIAYSYGWLILGVYLNDVIGFLLAAIWFAPWFRQLRVVTSIDAIRLRFGRVNEQFFSWIGIVATFLHGAVGLVGLSIILSTVFPMLDQVKVIVATGGVVLFIALVGGNWAVAASGFVQFMMIACMSVIAAILTVVHVGGVRAFIAQIPADHWQILRPAGSIKYDWIYMVSGWLASIYWRNNLGITYKFVPARDSVHARRSALVPLVGYLVMPILWFIPPLAAFTLVPTLAQDFRGLPNPGEASYFAVCTRVLPQGLLGLMIAAMFSATMGSMDGALNKNAGVLVKNFYQPLFRKNASDGELYFAGHMATLACGLLTIAAALLVRGTAVSLFDAFQYINAYVWMPAGVPLILGMFMRRTPSWAGWATFLFGAALSVYMYEILPLPMMQRMLTPMLGQDVYQYMVTNKFAITNLVGIPVTSLFFIATRLVYRPAPASEYEREKDIFFARMKTPVDFEKEVGADNTEAQARVLGRVMCIYSALIALILLVPNSVGGRLAVAACAAVMLSIGAGLLYYATRLRASASRGSAIAVGGILNETAVASRSRMST